MQEIKDFFSGLFSTDLWPPRWHCGHWTSFHGWLYIISDLAIWSAYFAMPAIIVLYISRRKNVRFHPIYFLFAAFILACGITHLLDALTFWYPMYRLSALARFVAGIISWVTVFYLIKLLPVAFSLKTAGELEIEVARNIQMKKELEVVNARLNEKISELEHANKELEQFAYISSHDLQEPLRKINNFVGMMGQNRNNEEQYQKYNGKIIDAAARMRRLITELLSYSRLSQGALNMEPVDLNEIITEMRTDFELLIEEKQVVINCGPLPVVTGIKTQLTQLFSNLLTNSIKFTRERPVIDISSRQLSADEAAANGQLKPGAAYVLISFRDNGIGFNPEFAGQIFSMFKRLNSTEEYEGTGIGLSVCKKIAENHGGAIRAISAPGQGATFEITLPLRQ